MFSVSSIVILNNLIQKEPGIIVGPISWLLGMVINIIFNIVYSITSSHSLGIAIVFFTIAVRILMIPLAFHQQKSMVKMQKLQPELKKIQDKYKDNSKDPEVQRKMNAEMQKLYAKHKYNPFGGCLPLIVQLPIFIALYYIIQNSYLYVNIIGDLYSQIGTALQSLPHKEFVDLIMPLATPKVPGNMTIDISVLPDLLKVLNKFSVQDWDVVKSSLQGSGILDLISQKENMEFFFGMNLIERVGFSFPKFFIPIFSGLTTFLSSWLMTRQNKSTDKAMQTQQRMMNIIMPLFMVYITTGLPGGVGIYWITSNVFQICQQFILNKFFERERSKEQKGGK